MKQLNSIWSQLFTESLREPWFTQFLRDVCFFNLSREEHRLWFSIWVDCFMLIGDNNELINDLKSILFSEFAIKVCSGTDSLLGVHIQWYGYGLMPHKHRCIEKILTTSNMARSDPVGTSISSGYWTSRALKAEWFLSKTVYQEAIGSFPYLSTRQMPEIWSAVNIISWDQANSTVTH